MNVQEVDCGFIIETPTVQIFFGKKNSQIENLQKLFPSYQFSRIHQVHGTQIQRKSKDNWSTALEGDAQWTELPSTALCISSADCAPVFICDPIHQRVAGIHAGWRGVASRIVPLCGEIFLRQGSKVENLYVFVGPHIQKQSFEVDEKVKNQLFESTRDLPEDCIEVLAQGKFHVDLNQIIKFQLQELGIQADHLFDLHLDTKSDDRFHSYRRDKQNSGRQLSFILQK